MKNTFTKEEIKLALGKNAERILDLLEPKEFDYTQITTLELALNQTEYSGNRKPNFSETEDEYSYRMMKEVIKVINPKDWKPKFNGAQKNWFIYWSVLPSGSGFSVSYAYCDYFGYSFVGSRLYFADEIRVNHFIKYFTELAKPFYILDL